MTGNELESIGREVAKYIGDGFKRGLSDSARSATKAFNGFYEVLRYQRDFDIISEEEYYRRLEQLRDRYFVKGTDNWVKYTKQIYKYQEKLLNDEKKVIEGLYEDIAEFASEKLEAIMKKQKKLADNLNSFGSLYNVNTVTINGVTDQYYSLHDISWDIDAINRYLDNYEKIKERTDRLSVNGDARGYLLNEIRQMDTGDALQYMNALLVADDGKFSQYVGKAYEKYTISQNVGGQVYAEDFYSAVDESCQYMKDSLWAAGLEIPEGFTVSGSISAQKFGEAFVFELDSQLDVIRGMIDEFNASLTVGAPESGNVYNTTNTSYNISSAGAMDTVEQIRRYETVKRLAGIG